MDFRLPYQFSFEPVPVPFVPVRVLTVPDDTLTPKEIIIKHSKGINDSRVSVKEPDEYLTVECGVPGGKNGVRSNKKQDDLLLGVQLPDPSFDYTEYEEFYRRSANTLSDVKAKADAARSLEEAKRVAAAAPAPPAPPAPPVPNPV